MTGLEKIELCGVVPVVAVEHVETAIPTAKALYAGGIDVMEITFRTDAAADSIRAVSEECREMYVGAGTVTTIEQCQLAVNSGAQFVVSPGFDEVIVTWCCEHGVLVFPGCVTPTEIMMAQKHCLNVLKFFPANVYGGLNALKALAGPFGMVRFIPTGGINIDNLADYIAYPHVFAVGGSWLAPKEAITACHFDLIQRICASTRKIVDEVRR